MEMRVDERRRHQPPVGLDLAGGAGCEPPLQRDDAAVANADIEARAAVRQIGATHDQIEHDDSRAGKVRPDTSRCPLITPNKTSEINRARRLSNVLAAGGGDAR